MKMAEKSEQDKSSFTLENWAFKNGCWLSGEGASPEPPVVLSWDHVIFYSARKVDRWCQMKQEELKVE